MHTVAVGGRDEEAKARLEAAGLSVRPAKQGSLELALRELLRRLRPRGGHRRPDPGGAPGLGPSGRPVRQRDRRQRTRCRSSPAASVRPGMVMFTEDGEFDVVESVERIRIDCPVYDLNVADTHNFVADGPRHPQLGVRLPRGGHPEHPGFPGRLRGRARDQARAELPLDADDPGRGERGDLQQPRADGQAPVDGRGGGRPGAGAGDGGRARRGAVGHGGDRAARGRGRVALGDRRLLPDECAVAGAGGHARAGADRLSGDRRDRSSTSGRRSRTRSAYLQFLVNPQDAGAFTRIANSPRRGIGQTSLSRVLAYADGRGHRGVGGGAARDVPGLATAARKALGRFMSTDGAAARAGRGRRAGRRPGGGAAAARPATWTRCRPSGRSRRRAGSRTSRSSCAWRGEYDATNAEGSLGEFLQQISLLADADTIRDDEGLVTLMTMHNAKGLEFPIVFMIGHGGGRSSRTRARSRRATSRRSAGSPTSASPGRCAT